MNINDIVRETAETVRELPVCAALPVLEENKGDIVKKLETEIAKCAFAVVVGWNGFTPVATPKASAGTSAEIVGDVTIVCSIFEKPVVNRKAEGSSRLLDVAQEIARELDGCAADGMDEVLHLKRISPVQELDRGVITCDVEFSTKSNL